MINGTCTAYDISNGDYFLENGTYKEKCGKGYSLSSKIECDDGNSINGDGCNY